MGEPGGEAQQWGREAACVGTSESCILQQEALTHWEDDRSAAPCEDWGVGNWCSTVLCKLPQLQRCRKEEAGDCGKVKWGAKVNCGKHSLRGWRFYIAEDPCSSWRGESPGAWAACGAAVQFYSLAMHHSLQSLFVFPLPQGQGSGAATAAAPVEGTWSPWSQTW